MGLGFLGNPASALTTSIISDSFNAGARASAVEAENTLARQERKAERDADAANRKLTLEQQGRQALQGKLLQTRFDTINDQTTAAKQQIADRIKYFQDFDKPEYDDMTRTNARKEVDGLQKNYGGLDQWRLKAIDEVMATGGLASPVFPEGFLGKPTAEPSYSPEKVEQNKLKKQTDEAQLLGANLANREKLAGLMVGPGNDKLIKRQTDQAEALSKTLGGLSSAVEGLRSVHKGYESYGGVTPQRAQMQKAVGAASQLVPAFGSAYQAAQPFEEDPIAKENRTKYFAEKVQPEIGKAAAAWTETLGLLQSGLIEDLIPGASKVMGRAFGEVGDYYSPEGAQKFIDFTDKLATSTDPDAPVARQIAGRLAPLKPLISDYSSLGKFYRGQTIK